MPAWNHANESENRVIDICFLREGFMKRLSSIALVLAVLSAILFLGLVFLRVPFPIYPLMSWQDALDILTVLILLPLYWVLFKNSASRQSVLWEEIIFIIFSALWVFGHGMHLSANSVNNLAEGMAKKQLLDITGTDIYTLTYFYDETLSHFLRDIGLVGFVALMIYHEWQAPAGNATVWWSTIAGGIIYGFTFFLVYLEGNTVVIGYPFALLVTLLGLIWGRKRLAHQPVLAFFFIAFLTAAVLYTGWGIYYGGWPPPSELGLI